MRAADGVLRSYYITERPFGKTTHQTQLPKALGDVLVSPSSKTQANPPVICGVAMRLVMGTEEAEAKPGKRNSKKGAVYF